MTVIGEAFVEVKPDAEGFGPAAEKSVSSSMKGVALKAAAAFGAGFATAKLVSGVKDAVQAAAESAQVGRITEQVVEQTGQAAGITADQIGDLATQLSNLTGVDDEAIQAASNSLLAFTNVKNVGEGPEAIFERTQRAALDLATVMGGDVQGATAKLGKALNDPEAGMKALARAGVALTDQQKEQIKTFQESGDILSAQQVLLDAVEGKFAGAAEAAADPVQKLSTVLGNVQEQIGSALLPALGPAADALGKLAQGIAPALEGVVGALAPVVETVGDALSGLGPIVQEAFTALQPALESLGPVIASLAEGIGPVLAEIGKALGILVPPLAKVAGALLAALGPVVARIVQALGKVIGALAPIFAKLAPVIEKVVGLLGDALGDVIDKLLTALEPLIPVFIELADKVFAAMAPVIPQLAEALGSLAISLAEILVALLPLIDPLLKLAVLFIEKVQAPLLVKLAEALALVANVLSGLLTEAAKLILPVTEALSGFFSDFSEMPQKFADIFLGIFNVWKGFVSDVLGFVEEVVGAVLGIPGRLLDLHTKIRELFVDVGLAIIEGLFDGIGKAAEFATDLASQVVNTMIDFINDKVIGGLNDLLEFQVPLPFGRKITIDPPDLPDIPNLGSGAILKAGADGVLFRGAERGQDEAVLPLPPGLLDGLMALAGAAKAGRLGGDSNTFHIYEQREPRSTAVAAINQLRAARYRSGRG